jgi:hypothetical protein
LPSAVTGRYSPTARPCCPRLHRPRQIIDDVQQAAAAARTPRLCATTSRHCGILLGWLGAEAEWVVRLAEAHHAGRLQAELTKLARGPLLVVDEVGYIPFEPEAANLFFRLVSSSYERASLILTSKKVFGRWGEVFGDDVVAAAMIDRSSTTPKSSPSKATATDSKPATSAASPRPPPTTHDQPKGGQDRPGF